MTNIHPSAIVNPGAQVGADVEIGPYCVIGGHVTLGDRTRLMAHVFIDGRTTLGNECTVFPFASLGTQTQDLKYKGGVTYVKIGDKTTIREYVTVNAGTAEGEITVVGAGCLLMASCHVAHKCQLGNGVIMANSVALAGHVTVEDQAIIGGLTGVHQFVHVGKMAMIGGLARVTQDIPPFMLAEGNPVEVRGINKIGMERRGVGEDAQNALKKAYKILYMEKLLFKDALQKISDEVPALPEVVYLLEFIRRSERGIVRP